MIRECVICGEGFDPSHRCGGGGHLVKTCPNQGCVKAYRRIQVRKRAAERYRSRNPEKIKTCHECGKILKDPRSKYCPGDCRKTAARKRGLQWARIKAHGNSDPIIKECQCGRHFQAINQFSRCQNCVPDRNKASRKRAKGERFCKVCGIKLDRNRTKSCQICKRVYKKLCWRLSFVPVKNTEKACLGCGKLFFANGHFKYHSKDCRNQHRNQKRVRLRNCSICGDLYGGRSNSKYCQKCRYQARKDVDRKSYLSRNQTSKFFQIIGVSIAVNQIKTQNEKHSS